MKKLLLLLLLAALLLSGCSPTEPEILFDESTEGIVSVILQDYNDGTIHYDTIGPDGQRQPTQPFESESVEILFWDGNKFDTASDKTDLKILKLAQSQNYTIQSLRILKQGEHRFAAVEWNVNFWDPHALYYYNPNADQLVELYTYDATQVIGLKALNLPHS